MANILIIGCGYVGTALGRLLLASGHNVWGLRRDPSQLPDAFHRIACDLADLSKLKLEFQPDYVFFMPSAGHHDLAAYKAVYLSGVQQLINCLHLNQVHPKRLFYISSTRVYGQNDGSWVDEISPTESSDPYAALLLAGEEMALNSSYPATIVRFGGIYGPERKYFLSQVVTGKIELSLKPIYTNCIHRDDCAGILSFLMNIPKPQPLYLGVDNEPTLKNTMIEWMVEQYQLQLSTTSGKSSLKEQQMRANKRCSNQRIRSEGYQFHYPNFREGYAKLESDNTHKNPIGK